MNLRSVIAVGLTTTMLATSVPVTAGAEEMAPPRAASPTDITLVVARAQPQDVLAMTSEAFVHARTYAPLTVTANPPKMTDIRLSSGAKTAIIVTAVVVGVLIIAGVVVLGKPGRHL